MKDAVSTIVVEGENRIESCAWSNDGRLMGVTGSSGNTYIYLTRLNMLASVWQATGNVAVLTSLKEVLNKIKIFNQIRSSYIYYFNRLLCLIAV